MADLAALKPGDRVLEIGTGSGYGAAVLSRLAGQVVTLERHAGLAEAAAETLREGGFGNVAVHHGDGTAGWPEGAPYDAIVVTAGAEAVPEALKEQLAPGGRLVIPVGPAPDRLLLKRILRRGEDFTEEPHGAVAFVPLVAGLPAAGLPTAKRQEGAGS